jgi:hypothetical protein
MIGNDIGIWLIIGLIPYYINQQQMKKRWILQVRALFWSLEIHHSQNRRNRWSLRIPLIERLRNACWATIMHLWGGGSPKK